MSGRESRYSGVLLVLLFAACSGGGGGTEGQQPAAAIVPRFAYVANLNDGTLSAFTVNAATGQLRHNGYVLAGVNPSSVTVDPAGKFVYTANKGGGVSGYAINASTGALSPVPNSPYAAGTNPVAASVDPSGRFLYVANQGSGNVSAFRIDAGTGALTPLTPIPGPFPAGTSPSAIGIDPAGKYLYVANSGGVSAFSIDANGALATIPGPFTAGTAPAAIGVDPTGKFVYVANQGSANISAFKIDANGALLPAGTFGAGTGPRSVGFDPAGKYLYVANSAGTISAYSIDASSGVLTPVLGTFTAGTSPIAVAIDPTGKFVYSVNQDSNDISIFGVGPNGSLAPLETVTGRFSPSSLAITRGTSAVTYTPRFAYVTNLGSNNVSAYGIDPGSGVLTQLGSSPFAGTDPFAIAADPSGSFAYVGNEANNNVSAYKIDPNGVLTAVSGSPYNAGTNPDSITVDPSGRFVYAGNVNSNNVSAYTITPTSGALTEITAGTGSPFSTAGLQPFSVAVDPAGKFAYVANQSSGNVSVFGIDPVSGELIRQATLVAAGSLPFSIVVDPTGKYAYVANRGSNNVSAYTISAIDGTLTEVTNSPFATGGGPRAIAMDAAGKYVYVANENDSTVSAFTIDATNNKGALSPVLSKPTVSTGGGPRSIVVDPSGKFVYVGNVQTDNVSGFTINAATGELTEIPNSPFAAGDGPFGITTTGRIQ
jgi:DNA-binding beta-propeller fold protein YncE